MTRKGISEIIAKNFNELKITINAKMIPITWKNLSIIVFNSFSKILFKNVKNAGPPR